MKYFKNNNNEIFAYDDEQVAQGYGKDLTPLESGEFYDGTTTTTKPYKLDDSYKAVERDQEGVITAPEGLIKQIQAEADNKRIQEQIAEAKEYLASTDFYFTVDKYATLSEERKLELNTLRAEARVLINSLEG